VNLFATNVDFSEIDHAVAPAIENRAAPRHRVHFNPQTFKTEKLAKHDLRRVNCELNFLTLWFDTTTLANKTKNR
jgi:hypothetical protein